MDSSKWLRWTVRLFTLFVVGICVFTSLEHKGEPHPFVKLLELAATVASMVGVIALGQRWKGAKTYLVVCLLFIGCLLVTFVWTGKWQPIRVAEFFIAIAAFAFLAKLANKIPLLITRTVSIGILAMSFLICISLVLQNKIDWESALTLPIIWIVVTGRHEISGNRERLELELPETTIAKF